MLAERFVHSLKQRRLRSMGFESGQLRVQSLADRDLRRPWRQGHRLAVLHVEIRRRVVKLLNPVRLRPIVQLLRKPFRTSRPMKSCRSEQGSHAVVRMSSYSAFWAEGRHHLRTYFPDSARQLTHYLQEVRLVECAITVVQDLTAGDLQHLARASEFHSPHRRKLVIRLRSAAVRGG